MEAHKVNVPALTVGCHFEEEEIDNAEESGLTRELPTFTWGRIRIWALHVIFRRRMPPREADGERREGGSRCADHLVETTSSRYRILFRLMALGYATAAMYHVAALAVPAFARTAYPPTYPPVRHIAFVMVDSLTSFLFLARPRWFIWPYVALTVQILQGHGLRGWQTWLDKHQLNWIDAITVFGALLGLALLLFDRLNGKSGEFTSAGNAMNR